MNEQAMNLAVDAVAKLGAELGVKLDTQLVAFLAGRLVESVASTGWRDARAAGQAASDAIKTADDAEALMRGGK